MFRIPHFRNFFAGKQDDPVSVSYTHLKELSLFPQNDYTNDGQLLGHIMIGAEMVHDAAQKIDGRCV